MANPPPPRCLLPLDELRAGMDVRHPRFPFWLRVLSVDRLAVVNGVPALDVTCASTSVEVDDDRVGKLRLLEPSSKRVQIKPCLGVLVAGDVITRAAKTVTVDEVRPIAGDRVELWARWTSKAKRDSGKPGLEIGFRGAFSDAVTVVRWLDAPSRLG